VSTVRETSLDPLGPKIFTRTSVNPNALTNNNGGAALFNLVSEPITVTQEYPTDKVRRELKKKVRIEGFFGSLKSRKSS